MNSAQYSEEVNAVYGATFNGNVDNRLGAFNSMLSTMKTDAELELAKKISGVIVDHQEILNEIETKLSQMPVKTGDLISHETGDSVEIREGRFNSIEAVITGETLPYVTVGKLLSAAEAKKANSIYVFFEGSLSTGTIVLLRGHGFVPGQEVTVMKKWYGEGPDLTPKNLCTSQIGILAMVLNPDSDSIVLVHEYGKWKMPSGTSDLGETVIDTCRREVREEIGLDLEDDFYSVGMLQTTKQVKGFFTDTCHVLVCTAKTTDLCPDGVEITQTKWMKFVDIQESDASVLTKKYVTLYLEGKMSKVQFTRQGQICV